MHFPSIGSGIVKARTLLIGLAAVLTVYVAAVFLPKAAPYKPLHYGYALSLELEAGGKSYSARSTYSCVFSGAVQQEGIVWGPDLLIYEGQGEPLAVALDDGQVIAIAFNHRWGFCNLNDQGRLWGWQGVPDLEPNGDHRLGYKLIERGFIDENQFREAQAAVDAAFRERRSVDLLANKTMLYSLWVFDAADPTILRHVDWRAPERALSDSVRLKRILIEPTRELPESALRAALPWAASQSPREFRGSNRWITWDVAADEAPEISDLMELLPGTQLDGGPRFHAIPKSNALCKDAVPNGSHPSNILKHAGQFIVPRIDLTKNRVSFSWAGPSEQRHPYGDRDFVRLDELALHTGQAGSAEWLLWDPEFCVDDGGCFRLGRGSHGDGHPFGWPTTALESFHDIGGTRCVWDRKTKSIYRLRPFAIVW